ncbi:MAG TPA: hypothetical protein VFM98_24115 [Ramlibacter sp.]|uniref:hypothetical protein n=1 Tax=Ramlibacter sp. TaxID=1917967 RepID=UPI002D7F8441|nr:hypothetical protein [Ramlibacter sp.]HET8748702.1 hypothetical protein [Ramlibacter sp.]
MPVETQEVEPAPPPIREAEAPPRLERLPLPENATGSLGAGPLPEGAAGTP